ncbi:MAG: ferrous iron transport protein A [Vallitaleaceae bacterium]|nr:ferrous iron transport protein A [Vallitaleaceae bacterium]
MGWGNRRSNEASQVNGIALTGARINREYTIKSVETNNNEVQDFLFTLGCYEGETITVISILADQYVVVVKDARYSIDKDLAECILI